MLHRRSIRFRLTVWYAAVLIGGLALFGGLLWVSLRHQLLADIDRDLAGRASRLESYFRNESARRGVNLIDELEEFCQALPETSYVGLRGAHGFSFHFPPSATGVPARSRMLERQFQVNGEIYDLELGARAQDVRYVLGLLRLLLWSLVPVVGAIACMGGYWLSGRALKPVQDVTAAALMISIENLSGRLPVPATGDEIARLAEVLNSMLGRLESAVKTLSQFAADASHELRTPLAVIRTTAELALRRGRPPESYRESLDIVVTESERMTRLVEDLLTLARSDTTAASMPRVPVDLRDILRAVHAEMDSLADKHGIQVQMSLGEEPAVVAGNRPALHRLFVLLLDNALKYSHAGGSVLVNLGRVEGRLGVTIRDFGTGIAEADLPHIFERFYRADRARSGGGHGLGLPLAETIARAHGATIDVHSTVGEGSTFRVTFAQRDVLPEPPAYPEVLVESPGAAPLQ
jgi:two-component system, OmpR family, heavy metal sensor histidine kinase CusS